MLTMLRSSPGVGLLCAEMFAHFDYHLHSSLKSHAVQAIGHNVPGLLGAFPHANFAHQPIAELSQQTLSFKTRREPARECDAHP